MSEKKKKGMKGGAENKNFSRVKFFSVMAGIAALAIIGAILFISSGWQNKPSVSLGDQTNLTKNYCTPASRKAELCYEVYKPVCGWFNESIKCFKYPCAATYTNDCFACKDPKVEYWTPGECPK